MKVGDLFVSLGIKADTAQLQKITTGFSNLRRGLLETKLAFIGAMYALDRFVMSSAEGVANIENIALQTGLSADALQKWDMAGQMSSLALGTGQTAQALGNLQKQLASIAMGQGNIAPFQMLGIDVAGKNAFDVISDIRNSIKDLRPDIASNIVSQMGLDPTMIAILRMSNEQFTKMTNNQSILGKGGRQGVLQAGMAIRRLEIQLKLLKDQIVSSLAPIISKYINQFTKWLNSAGNRQKLQEMAKGFIRFGVEFVNAITKVIEGIINLMDYVGKGSKKFDMMGYAIGALAMSFSPFLRVILGIGLALNDIQNWKAGGKAMFGDLYSTISGIADKLKYLKNIISSAFDFDKSTQENIDKFTGAMSNLKGSLQLGLLGALLGGKIGGVQGALVGGGIGLGAGLINWLIDANKDDYMDLVKKSMKDRDIKRNLTKDQSSNKSQINNITMNTTINTEGAVAPEIFAKTVKSSLENLQLNNHGF